ncbi:hypothetical protein STEG23_008629, partial [Scotinomys teguina]
SFRYIFGIPPLILVLLPVTSSDCYIKDKEGKAYESVLMISIDELSGRIRCTLKRKLPGKAYRKDISTFTFEPRLVTVCQHKVIVKLANGSKYPLKVWGYVIGNIDIFIGNMQKIEKLKRNAVLTVGTNWPVRKPVANFLDSILCERAAQSTVGYMQVILGVIRKKTEQPDKMTGNGNNCPNNEPNFFKKHLCDDTKEAAFLNRAARKLKQFLKMNISEEFNIHLLTVSQGTQTLVNCTSK